MEKVKSASKIIKISFSVWILSIIVFIFTIFFTSGQEVFDDLTALIFVIDIFVGTVVFGVFILALTMNMIQKQQVNHTKRSLKTFLSFGLRTFLLLAILPLFLLYKTTNLSELIKRLRENKFKLSFLKPKKFRDIISKFAFFLLILFTLLPIWIVGYIFTGTVVGEQLVYINESIPSVGASMYPTFPEGESVTGMLPYPSGLGLFGKRVLGYQLRHGDIVVVENDKIRKSTKEIHGSESGWLKRIVAMEGDELELRDGIFYLNNEPQKEPYIARARSTFGETFLKECTKVKVPESHIFVMGDNRTGSGDSREIGFIEISAVNHVLPLDKQMGVLDKNWRDTTKDLEDSVKINLDESRFIELLNEKRSEVGTKTLKYQTKLEQSAFKRGEVVLKYDDFSYEATRSGYTQLKAMNEAGYSNIVWNEGIIQGHYQAEELIDYLYEFSDWKKNLLHDKDLQEIGISEVEGILNGCPSQVIVMHFAGYIPPNYKSEDIESWGETINNLNSVVSSWEAVKGQGWINQEDLKRLLDLLNRERTIASNILARMQANKWLTNDEENSIKEYDRLSTESVELANKLNSK